MSSTRQPPPIRIYQDYTAEMVHPRHPQARSRPQLQPSAMPLQPTSRNIQPTGSLQSIPALYPTMSGAPPQFSPLKSQHFTPATTGYGYVPIIPSAQMPPSAATLGYSSSQPGLPSSTHMSYVSLMPQPVFSTFDANFDSFEQRHFPTPPAQHNDFVDFPDPVSVRRQPLKRSYSEAAIVQGGSTKRAKVDSDHTLELPDPGNMPPVEDNGQKPPYSYAQMIGMAILRSPTRKLTLSEIYKWIEDHFKHYREAPKGGWMNSIRHNLSLNKSFVKQERAKGDAGKGNYWMIVPGNEMQFYKEKARKHPPTSIMLQQHVGMTTLAMPQPLFAQLPPQQSIIHSQPDLLVQEMPPRPRTAHPILPQLSSDATVPASDPALGEDEERPVLRSSNPELNSTAVLPPPSSPPILHSSPPIVDHGHHRAISSPTHVARGSPQRQKASKDLNRDSGYFSSLESSVRRPKSGVPLTSELGFEKTRTRHGRAEEEIARIRSSSHDVTPSHNRVNHVHINPIDTSSPPRQTMGEEPSTPAVFFKMPAIPPPSVSPNTQLRQHRAEMNAAYGQSPAKLEEPFEAQSPFFNVDTPAIDPFHEHFDFNFTMPGTPFVGSSPLRPLPSSIRLAQQAAKTNSALADVTKRANARTPNRPSAKISDKFFLKPGVSATVLGSPLKRSTTASSSIFHDANNENDDSIFAFTSLSDGPDHEENEFDISQGFPQIGASSNTTSGPMLPSGLGLKRPGLGRSLTTRF